MAPLKHLCALAVATALNIVLAATVQAQDIGIIGPGHVIGNGTAAPAVPTDASIASVLAQASGVGAPMVGDCTLALVAGNAQITCTQTAGVPFGTLATASGPGSSVTGDLAYWTNTTGSGMGDAPLNWSPLGGPSGNGGFSAPAPVAVNSPDLTTVSSRINLGGTVNTGFPVCFTLNYNNAALTARSVQICYTPIGGDTLSSVATGLANALAAAGQVSPLSVDFNTLAARPTFRFFIPGTVASAGVQVAFNFYWLGAAAGTPSLTIVNSSNASTTVTETINGVLTAISGTGGAPPLTLDTVPQPGCSRGTFGTPFRTPLAGDIICLNFWEAPTTAGAGSSNVYGSIGVAISNPSAGAPLGLLQMFTGFANPVAANLNIAQGMWLQNATGVLTPTYPGVLANCIGGAVADPGAGSLRACGWVVPGRAVVGTWGANTSYAMFGTNALDQTAQANYALVQGLNGDTLLNAASGQTVQIRIGNAAPASVTISNLGLTALGVGTVPTTVGALPTCNGGYEGQRAYVTDQATAVAYRGAVTPSGATRQAVLCSNSAWIQD